MTPRCRSVSSSAETTGTMRSAAAREVSSSPVSTSSQKPSMSPIRASHTLPDGVGTGPEPLEDAATAFKAKLDAALAETADLTTEQRSARNGLANRQVTIR